MFNQNFAQMETKTQTHTPRKTAFMAVVYFKYKKGGVPFTQAEIYAKDNRKQFDSYDFTYTFNKTLIRNEELGLKKLKRMIAHQFHGKYFGGYIVASKMEEKIFTFGGDGEMKTLNVPVFFHDTERNEILLQRVNPLVTVAPNAVKNFIPQENKTYAKSYEVPVTASQRYEKEKAMTASQRFEERYFKRTA